jgi:hypothetical protein
VQRLNRQLCELLYIYLQCCWVFAEQVSRVCMLICHLLHQQGLDDGHTNIRSSGQLQQQQPYMPATAHGSTRAGTEPSAQVAG